jgi:hypothetical protein
MIQAIRKSVCAIIPAFGQARFIGTVVCGILEHVDRVPIRTIYGDERSKVKPMRDTFRYIRLLAKYRSDGGSDRRVVFKPKSQKAVA